MLKLQKPTRFTGALLVCALGPLAFAQMQLPSPGTAIQDAARASAAHRGETSSAGSTSVEVLNSRNDLRVEGYLTTLLPRVRENWWAAIGRHVNKPERARGVVVVAFVVARSGEIRDVKITSSSGRDDLDEAVLRGLQTTQLPPFPAAFTLPELQLRFHFYYSAGAWRRPSALR